MNSFRRHVSFLGSISVGSYIESESDSQGLHLGAWPLFIIFLPHYSLEAVYYE